MGKPEAILFYRARVGAGDAEVDMEVCLLYTAEELLTYEGILSTPGQKSLRSSARRTTHANKGISLPNWQGNCGTQYSRRLEVER